MFIVWRQRPVEEDVRTPFLTDIRTASGDRAWWKPLYCDHRGPGRIAWTALAMHSERRGGKPRQRLLHRFPSIRSCCIGVGYARAAWWHDVGTTFKGWWEGGTEGPGEFLARDKSGMLAKLRQVVPRPTPAGGPRVHGLPAGEGTGGKSVLG